MKLGDLAKQVTPSRVVGDPATLVRGLVHDSRHVTGGEMLACLVGDVHDGHRFAAAAVQLGASSLLVQDGRVDPDSLPAPALVVPDTRAALPACAAAIYGDPSRRMTVVAVTGTNGKTTTTRMVGAIAEAGGRRSGTIGTLGAFALGRELPCEHTTPEADELQRTLRDMLGMGVDFVAMEASSHGLARQRTDAVAFRAGAFLNLTQDHLDYHGTMDAYLAAKLRLFTDYPRASGGPFLAVVNIDDPAGEVVMRATEGDVLTVGMRAEAQIRAANVSARAEGASFDVHTHRGNFRVDLPIGGLFQVHNALAAIGLAVGLGFDDECIARGLAAMQPVPGRFESVPTGRDWGLIVDFAHTPDGLENLIASARRLNPSRLVLVFGCGGNRDRGKRPIMGRLAAEGADRVIVTSDNVRHERPEAIIDDVLAGMRDGHASVAVEPDRAAAVRRAVREARDGDLVVIAGKGGETTMIVGDEHIPYDDRIVAREALEELGT